ncbi:unnamed protein product [Schistocephalus solidus]|uniref:Zinc finger CCCH domain-containing protein 14 n=1 Tax=Schistocephalus solidus TaxID=70667 RepID=A0A183T2C4_SCHSO|nr:unnamed protein product [Schistocephalus solidus]
MLPACGSRATSLQVRRLTQSISCAATPAKIVASKCLMDLITDEFVEEGPTLVQKETVLQATTKPKEQRRIVSTSSLTGSSTEASSEMGPGLKSVVKLTAHVPSSTTLAPHARPGGLLLKRAMSEAQASVASTTSISPTKSTRPAAVVHGRKRPADQMGSTLEDDIAPPAAKSTRFVVTLNDSAINGVGGGKGANFAGGVSNVKSRLGPRVTTSRTLLEADRDDAVGPTLEMLDARDILIAKKLQKSKTSLTVELRSRNVNPMITAEKSKDTAPMVISLNDTDEDELAETARLLKSPVKIAEEAKDQSAEPPKRENIPRYLTGRRLVFLSFVVSKICFANLYSTLERCKYWPSCRNGASCQYMHPKEECQNFPNCRFGDRCLYFHPACKFGAGCSRLGCPFSHAGQPPSIATQTLGVLCRFYPRCKNAACPFLHPPMPLAKTAVAKVCRYGSACTNRVTCPFSHPTGAAVGANVSIPATNKLKWIAPGKASNAASNSMAKVPETSDNQLTGITPTTATLASSGVTV